jgi:hypothetical protein
MANEAPLGSAVCHGPLLTERLPAGARTCLGVRIQLSTGLCTGLQSSTPGGADSCPDGALAAQILRNAALIHDIPSDTGLAGRSFSHARLISGLADAALAKISLSYSALTKISLPYSALADPALVNSCLTDSGPIVNAESRP